MPLAVVDKHPFEVEPLIIIIFGPPILESEGSSGSSSEVFTFDILGDYYPCPP